MEKNNKLVEFIKTHKKAVAIAGAVAVGGVMLVLTQGRIKLGTTQEDLPIPELEIGKITELWKWGRMGKPEKRVTTLVTDLTIADLGRLGEELTKIEGVELTSSVDLILGCIVK